MLRKAERVKMEENNVQDPEQQMMMFCEKSTVEIDPRKSRFPYCVVWTPLPVISWFIPFIGHVGICREDGVILDFAGPNFVCVDNFAFGAVARFIQINNSKECTNTCGIDDELNGGDTLSWDNALRKGTQEFQHHSYSLFTCNCHSFVCNNLNRLGFRSGGWNVVNLAALMFLKGQWVSTGAMVRSCLPFVVICCLGVLLFGFKFLGFVAFFALVLVGWFIIGTYFFKDLIQL